MLIRDPNTQHPVVGFLKDRIRGEGAGKEKLTRDALQQVRDQVAQSGGSTARLDTLLQNYDTIDLNGDGMSKQELASYNRNGKAADFFGNQKFSKDELIAFRDRLQQTSGKTYPGLDAVVEHFNDADTNSDGSVTMSELRVYAKAHGFSLTKSGNDEQSTSAGSDEQDKAAEREARAKAALQLIQRASLSDPLLTSSGDGDDTTLTGLAAIPELSNA